MLLTIAQFNRYVSSDLDHLVGALQESTGRSGGEERAAWLSSLPVVSSMLKAPGLQNAHVFFGGGGHASLEYQLPAASNWCDMILLGARDGRPSAVVFELKHWATASDVPGPVEGLMTRAGALWLHPSRQVGRYVEYIRNYHSEVQASDASVNGCVIFTRSGSVSAYREGPNRDLAIEYPLFTSSVNDVNSTFPRFVECLIAEPAERFALNFEAGRYRQDRGFVSQIGRQFEDARSSPFVLLDNQEKALLVCRSAIERFLQQRDGLARKHVVAVLGPPGSGKSVVAARLWASLATSDRLQAGDIVITTTSSSQNSNWAHLVERASSAGAVGVVKKATQYTPISTHELGRLRRGHGEDLFADPAAWRNHLAQLRTLRPFRSGAEDDAYLVSIVDEAHGLINPEHVAGRGQFGFVPTLGPQAYHIIRASGVTCFFLDPEQGFRHRENTRVVDLEEWATELGASFSTVDLSGAQFRCAGSREFVAWIDAIRTATHPAMAARIANRWRASRRPAADEAATTLAERPPSRYQSVAMQFEIISSLEDLEAGLRVKAEAGHTCRLLSSFSTPWRTRNVPNPHGLADEFLDFRIPLRPGAVGGWWSRAWNVVPAGDYSYFVQGRVGGAIATDPLCEVGCPYVVRGFDFDFVGILWGMDLVWRTDRWRVLPEHVHETALSQLARRATREIDIDGPAHEELLAKVWQAYRILLTRALRGVALWVADAETRQYLRTASVSSSEVGSGGD